MSVERQRRGKEEGNLLMRNVDEAKGRAAERACSSCLGIQVFSQHSSIGKNLEEASLLTVEVPGRHMD